MCPTWGPPTIYSTLFGAGSDYTGITRMDVPAGYVWILNCITAFYGADTPGSIEFGINGLGNVFYCYNLGSGPAESYLWNGRVVIPEGGQIYSYPLAGGWDWSMSGYQLTAPS